MARSPILTSTVRILVDGAVRQMTKQVTEVTVVVALGREAHKAFSVQVQIHGPHPLWNQHVYAHVPLVPADEQRVTEVLLKDALMLVLQLVHVIDNCDSASPAHISWLADPEGALVALLVLVGYDLAVVVGEDERQRRKVKDLTVQLSQLLEHASQIVLRTNQACLWNVRQLLVGRSSSELSK